MTDELKRLREWAEIIRNDDNCVRDEYKGKQGGGVVASYYAGAANRMESVIAQIDKLENKS